MPRWQKIDEFHIEVFVPLGRTPNGLRAALADPKLLTRLLAAIRQALAEKAVLKAVRVTASR